MPRYALYYCPRSGTALHTWGTQWLGRGDDPKLALAQPEVPGVSRDSFARLTEEPRRYGLHATLKAPFHLAEGADYMELRQALKEYCTLRSGFVVSSLEVKELADFLALVPTHTPQALRDLARDCTVSFDKFRAPPTASELARRTRARLSERQIEYLVQWGYPYVLDEYRFHITLTGSLAHESAVVRLALLQAANRVVAETLSTQALVVDSICVFVEHTPDGPFELLERFDFQGRLA